MKAYVWWLTGHSAVWVVFAELTWGEGWLWQLACLQDIFILSSFKKKKKKKKLKKGLTIPMSGMNIASPKVFLTCGAPSPHVPSKKKNHIVSNEYNLSLFFFFLNIILFLRLIFDLVYFQFFTDWRNISSLETRGTSQAYFKRLSKSNWCEPHKYNSLNTDS